MRDTGHGGIQEMRDTGQEGCRTGGSQDSIDGRQEGCRTEEMQDRRDSSQGEWRTGAMQDTIFQFDPIRNGELATKSQRQSSMCASKHLSPAILHLKKIKLFCFLSIKFCFFALIFSYFRKNVSFRLHAKKRKYQGWEFDHSLITHSVILLKSNEQL